MTSAYGHLALAIISEVIGTLALKASTGEFRLGPIALVVASYSLAFFFLSRALESVPVGVAYAIWSGSGIVLIALLAWVFFGQTIDRAGVLGLTMIVGGVLVLNLFSRSALH